MHRPHQLTEDDVINAYTSLEDIELAIHSINILKGKVKNALLNTEMPAIEAMLQRVINAQKLHIDNIRFNQSELRKISVALAAANEKSKLDLILMKKHLQSTSDVQYLSAQFAETRAAFIGKMEIQLSFMERKLKNIMDILRSNDTHAKNSKETVAQLEQSDANVAVLKRLLESHKTQDTTRPRGEGEAAIDTAVKILTRINELLNEIEWNVEDVHEGEHETGTAPTSPTTEAPTSPSAYRQHTTPTLHLPAGILHPVQNSAESVSAASNPDHLPSLNSSPLAPAPSAEVRADTNRDTERENGGSL